MKSSVTRLKPRHGSYEQALEAFTSGDFSSSAELASHGASVRELILLSRNFTRLGQPAQALEAISSADIAHVPHELAAEALILRVTSLNALKRFDEAAGCAVEARVRCISSGIIALEAELLFVQAIGHMFEGDYSAAELLTRSILDLEPRATPWIESNTYRFNLEYFRFRAYDLLGTIEGTRANYDAQAGLLLQAFEEFDRSGIRDDYVEAVVLSNFAEVGVGIGLSGIAEVALTRSKRIDWTIALAVFEFKTFSALAQASAIAGDQLGALRFLRRCNGCAPTPALQLRSTVERARILSDIGESFSSREELDHAIRLSKSIDWAIARESDQRQLLFLAAQVASYNGTEADRLLKRYDGLKSSLPDTVLIRDDRFRGEELVARSAILRANGDHSRAIMILLDALEIFKTCNDPVNAGNVAAEIALLTGEIQYVEIARAQAQKQPLSILARKVACLEELMATGAPV